MFIPDPGSWIQRSKRHRIPDPQDCNPNLKKPLLCAAGHRRLVGRRLRQTAVQMARAAAALAPSLRQEDFLAPSLRRQDFLAPSPRLRQSSLLLAPIFCERLLAPGLMMVPTADEVVEGCGSAAVDGAGGGGGVLFGSTLPSFSTPVKIP
jgi:hypothetical protein